MLHGLAESYDWMEKYVKNRPAEAQEGKARGGEAVGSGWKQNVVRTQGVALG